MRAGASLAPLPFRFGEASPPTLSSRRSPARAARACARIDAADSKSSWMPARSTIVPLVSVESSSGNLLPATSALWRGSWMPPWTETSRQAPISGFQIRTPNVVRASHCTPRVYKPSPSPSSGADDVDLESSCASGAAAVASSAAPAVVSPSLPSPPRRTSPSESRLARCAVRARCRSARWARLGASAATSPAASCHFGACSERKMSRSLLNPAAKSAQS
mmetsp:Transcript_6464/g.22882  ORF Transcript_6464/g.22882 Transcript_6464/m.22882 type:complete len:220 (+) Transcript_6464:672-1331(+)